MAVKQRLALIRKAFSLPGRLSLSTGSPFWVLSGGSAAMPEFSPDLVRVSSVAGPVINWIASAMTEARLMVRNEAGEVEDGPLPAMLRNPGALWDQSRMVQWLTGSLCASGNGYLHIERDGTLGGIPTSLEFVDPGTVTEASYTRRFAGGNTVEVRLNPNAPRQLVRFRFGVSQTDPNFGVSPLASCVSELAVDATAARFAQVILHNLGVPGVIVMPVPPSDDEDVELTPEFWQRLKEKWDETVRSDRRGSMLGLEERVDIKPLDINLRGLNPVEFRNVTEERITSALRIPAAVIGFGTGLQQTKVGATLKEQTRQAWRSGVLPWMRLIKDAFNAQLLPEFYAPRDAVWVDWDLTAVPELQDDFTRKLDHARQLAELGYSVNSINQRLDLGMPELPDGDRTFLPVGRWDPNETPE